jgi:diguanylate cyclase (GGDEF)-like protein
MYDYTNLRILIIDDNPEIHKDFIKILTRKPSAQSELANLEKEIFDQVGLAPVSADHLPNFQIDTATQGQEGVERIAQALKKGIPYALAFVDIRMPPGWDGIETIKHIWALDPDVQIVICTAYSDYSWEETIEQLGKKENLLILKKPFDNVAVRQLSVALTKKWQLLQQSHEYTSLLEEQIKERTKSLEQSLSITRGTLESSQDGILVLDANHKVIDYNKLLLQMWNIQPTMLATKDGNLLLSYISQQVGAKDHQLFDIFIREMAGQTQKAKIEKFSTNDKKTVECYAQPYKLENNIAGQIWGFRDITKRALLEEKIHYQATHDGLTQLPNRILLVEKLRRAIKHSQEKNTHFFVLFLDLDRFKLINDSFTHTAGDELLKNVVKRIKCILHEEDILARLGGDEFVGVLTKVENRQDAEIILQNILTAFQESFIIMNHKVVVAPSIGVSVYPEDGANEGELLANADLAMYHAKELGGNRFYFYTKHLSLKNIERLELEAELHHALKNHEFFLCYQPQYDLSQKKFTSVEALIRWQHPTKGLILPINFIPIAEESGFILPIGEWVLREACEQNKRWQDAGLAPIRVAVNIGTNQFNQPDLVEKIQTILAETGLNPEYLELELTENIIIKNTEATQKIAKLRKLGIYVALDDFGTGYSSLNYLRSIRLDRLKIDQSFIHNINQNRDDEVIIQAIISMANNLNLEIVAEGVETQNQLQFLQSKQCGEIQGFYFSKPLTAPELEKLLRDPKKVTEYTELKLHHDHEQS